MVVMFEVAPPFRLRPKVERFGPLVRVIWGWFSISYIAAGVNEMARAFRLDEREECALLAESATAYTQFQTVEHYKIAAAIAAGIRKRSNVELTGAAPHGQRTKLQEIEK